MCGCRGEDSVSVGEQESCGKEVGEDGGGGGRDGDRVRFCERGVCV